MEVSTVVSRDSLQGTVLDVDIRVKERKRYAVNFQAQAGAEAIIIAIPDGMSRVCGTAGYKRRIMGIRRGVKE